MFILFMLFSDINSKCIEKLTNIKTQLTIYVVFSEQKYLQIHKFKIKLSYCIT